MHPRMRQRHAALPTEYAVTLRAKVAGIDTDYDGEILLSDVDPQQLHPGVRGQGPGGLPGHRHRPGQPQHQDQGTRVAYTVAGMTGGKLAECGESLILKAGEKIIERFFAAFIDYMAGQPRLAPPPAARARASRPVQLPLVLGAGAGGDRRVPELPHPLQVVDSLANRDGCGHSAVIC